MMADRERTGESVGRGGEQAGSKPRPKIVGRMVGKPVWISDSRSFVNQPDTDTTASVPPESTDSDSTE